MRSRWFCVLEITMASTITSALSAQGAAAAANKVLPSDSALIANAISAAPEPIGKNATVVAFDAKGQMRTLQKGSNGYTCFPDDPSEPGNVPMCLDSGGLAWAQAWMGKKTPATNLPIGVAYMLQGSWTQSNTDPFAARVSDNPGITTGPVMMILNTRGMLEGYPRDAANPGAPFIMWPGTPYEHLMVPVAGK